MIQSRAGKLSCTISTTLRLPKELRDKMQHQATSNGRSLNTHMVMLLTKSCDLEEVATT